MAVKFATLDMFFDRSKVIRRMDTKTRRVLAGTGSATRTYIQRSMRPGGKKRKSSLPGQPPRWHTKLLRGSGKNGVRGIAFNYEPRRKSVIIGVLPLDKNRPDGASNRRTIPELLEYGGTVSQGPRLIVQPQSGRRSKRPARKLTYKPRPYIAPALPYARKVMEEKMRTISL